MTAIERLEALTKTIYEWGGSPTCGWGRLCGVHRQWFGTVRMALRVLGFDPDHPPAEGAVKVAMEALRDGLELARTTDEPRFAARFEIALRALTGEEGVR